MGLRNMITGCDELQLLHQAEIGKDCAITLVTENARLKNMSKVDNDKILPDPAL